MKRETILKRNRQANEQGKSSDTGRPNGRGLIQFGPKEKRIGFGGKKWFKMKWSANVGA